MTSEEERDGDIAVLGFAAALSVPADSLRRSMMSFVALLDKCSC